MEGDLLLNLPVADLLGDVTVCLLPTIVKRLTVCHFLTILDSLEDNLVGVAY